ncbi:MAG: ABC transporter substrate-binding protein, partial [Candidatus Adiutrix sp.]
IGLTTRPDLVARPLIAFIMFHYEPSPNKRYEKLIAHKAHLVENPRLPQEGPSFAPNMQIKNLPTFETRYLAFNAAKPYSRMQNVRRALSFILETAFQGRPGYFAGVFPPGLFYNAPRRVTAPEEYDRTKQSDHILQEIGLPSAPLILAFNPDDKNIDADVEIIEQVLKASGIKLTLSPLKDKNDKILDGGNYDLFLGTRTPEIPAPDLWLAQFLDSKAPPSQNPARFQNDRADSLITEIATSVAEANDGPQEIQQLERERAAKVAELADIAVAESPYVFLYNLEVPVIIDETLARQTTSRMWPLASPFKSGDLRPLNFRSGANPTGRRPQQGSSVSQ